YGRTPSEPAERIVDDAAERLDRMRADEGPAVDQERRRAGDAQRARLRDIGLHRSSEAPLVQTAHESRAIETELHRVAHQVLSLECRLLPEESVVVRPELPGLGRAARRLVCRSSEIVEGQGMSLKTTRTRPSYSFISWSSDRWTRLQKGHW